MKGLLGVGLINIYLSFISKQWSSVVRARHILDSEIFVNFNHLPEMQKIVIAGAGEVGYHLIENLCREENLQILAIDNNLEVLEKLKQEFEVKIEHGNIIDSSCLNTAYMAEVDLFLAITNSDETNMIACKMASEAGAKKTVCRIRQVDLGSSKKKQSLESLGIDYVINPVELVAEEIYRLVLAPNIVERYEFANRDVSLVGFKIHSDSTIVDQSVENISVSLRKFNFQLGLIQRNDLSVIPQSDFVIQSGDIVYFFCKTKDFQKLRQFLGYSKKRLGEKRIFINGGGHIGVRLAKRLEDAGQNVKVIEKDIARSYHITERLQKSFVLNFSGTDLKQLVSEGVEDAHYFISVTDNESLNMTSCLMASGQGVGRTICLVQQPEYISIIDQKTPISLGVSPRVLTTRYLTRFIQDSSIHSYFPINNSHIAVLEIRLTEYTPCLSVPIEQLQFPDDVVVSLIKRKGKLVVPSGGACFQVGDTVLLILHKMDREKTMKFFQPLSF